MEISVDKGTGSTRRVQIIGETQESVAKAREEVRGGWGRRRGWYSVRHCVWAATKPPEMPGTLALSAKVHSDILFSRCRPLEFGLRWG